MKIDCHVHLLCSSNAHGAYVSGRMRRSPAYWFIGKKYNLTGKTIPALRDKFYISRILDFVAKSELDRAVLLAFDQFYDKERYANRWKTHLFVPNDYVAEVCAQFPKKFLFGASVHPYRRNALDDLDRVAAQNAVLIKLLPNSHGFDPADPQLDPYWKKLADLKLALLIHGGFEHTIPVRKQSFGRPEKLERALDAGVNVIVAHCGTAGLMHWRETMGAFWKLVQKYPNCYGDTSALTNFWRAKYLKFIFDPDLLEREYKVRIEHPADHLVHGSDFPIPITPFVFRKRLAKAERKQIRAIESPLQKDIELKRRLGLPDDVLTRAAKLFPRLA